jgi:hypothetical protein
MAGIGQGRARPAVAGLLAALFILMGSSEALAQTGGMSTPGAPTVSPAAPTGQTSGRPGHAKLLKSGLAVPPPDAPPAIQAAIAAGNAIHTFPYHWGGGHGSFIDTGYDCSGAVSYVLHAAGLLTSPLPSGPLAASWGAPGKGNWITVYANATHAYMVVAGVRFDTSAVGERLNQGSGPRWRYTKRKARGYTAKHFPGY